MYYAKIKWYAECVEGEHFSHVIVCASSYKQAMEYIEHDFDEIITIELEELCSEDVKYVYLPDDCVEAVKNKNTF